MSGERLLQRRLSQVGEGEALAQLAGGPLPYTLRRSSRSRGLRITIHPRRGVVASVPPSSRHGWSDPLPLVERFLREREPWVRRHLARQREAQARLEGRPRLGSGRLIPFLGRPHRVHVAVTDEPRSQVALDASTDTLVVRRGRHDPRSVETVLECWFRDHAAQAIRSALARYEPRLGVRPAAVTLRDPRTRWGSCSSRGRLCFSWRLILAPPGALDAVVVHELCHLRVFGHGARFRALLEAHAPNHAELRRWLREHADELHAALDASVPPTPDGSAEA